MANPTHIDPGTGTLNLPEPSSDNREELLVVETDVLSIIASQTVRKIPSGFKITCNLKPAFIGCGELDDFCSILIHYRSGYIRDKLLDGFLAHSEVERQLGIGGPIGEMAQEDGQLETKGMAFLMRFRFDREGIIEITGMIHDDIAPRANRNHAIQPVDKVCAALHFYATGCFQNTDGDTMKISQPSISRIIHQVSLALVRRLGEHVRLPNEEERRVNADTFYRMANFPGIIGLIDGTNVRIQAPTENEEQFVNRKRYHSINVQIVVNAKSEIINVNAQWPGSVHDSRILRESGLDEVLENTEGHLLGIVVIPSTMADDTFSPTTKPCGRTLYIAFNSFSINWFCHKYWLYLPLLILYYRAHKHTRCLVERSIGQLKRRFHCLHGELRVSPLKASRIIASCCVLHNIAKRMNMPDNEDAPDHPDDEQPPHEIVMEHDGVSGQAYRQHIVDNHFVWCIFNVLQF
ncbi:putative nuclease HARBI1, partial [Strongylocentrotus purpuratus]|uniref:Putative nuclease HARBI1 n=1 Tax=Strongylocentrotus purpuratus TaxID=7668 RepID=A0A7M7NED8_STRPU